MKVKAVYLAVFVLVAVCACKKVDSSNSSNANDKQFVTMAALSNHAEISAAQLALTKSTDATVQAFAQKMITDHTKAQTVCN